MGASESRCQTTSALLSSTFDQHLLSQTPLHYVNWTSDDHFSKIESLPRTTIIACSQARDDQTTPSRCFLRRCPRRNHPCVVYAAQKLHPIHYQSRATEASKFFEEHSSVATMQISQYQFQQLLHVSVNAWSIDTCVLCLTCRSCTDAVAYMFQRPRLLTFTAD